MKNLGYYGRRNICGERVRMARLAKRISQETLAAKMQTLGVNIAQDAISKPAAGWSWTTNFAPSRPSFKSPLKNYLNRKKNRPTERPSVGLIFYLTLRSKRRNIEAEQRKAAIQMKSGSTKSETTIARLRCERGLTQAALAKGTGVNIRTIQKFDSGERGIETASLAVALRIADFLGVHPRDLI